LDTQIVIIGSSGHAGYVLDELPAIEDAALVGVAPGCPEEDVSDLAKKCEAIGLHPKVYGDYRSMLDNTRPDIACVNPFFYLNSEVTVECLRRGIHVFCEKPLALDTDALQQVRDAHAASGAHLGMMLNYRYDPRFYTARRLVREGRIGTPAAGYAQKSYRFGKRPDYYKQRGTFGGLIPWVGIHAIDWFRWVSGLDYVSVSAHHSNLGQPDYPELEDSACCLFELENGGSAAMSFDYMRPMGAKTHGDDRLRLVGTKGILEIRDELGLVLTDESGQVAVDLVAPLRGLFTDFAASVREGLDCLVSAHDAIDVTRIALEAREAADTGKVRALA